MLYSKILAALFIWILLWYLQCRKENALQKKNEELAQSRKSANKTCSLCSEIKQLPEAILGILMDQLKAHHCNPRGMHWGHFCRQFFTLFFKSSSTYLFSTVLHAPTPQTLLHPLGSVMNQEAVCSHYYKHWCAQM